MRRERRVSFCEDVLVPDATVEAACYVNELEGSDSELEHTDLILQAFDALQSQPSSDPQPKVEGKRL